MKKISLFSLLRFLFGCFCIRNRFYVAGLSPIQVPLLDFSIFYWQPFLICIQVLFFVAIFCFIFGFKVEWSGLIAGACHLFWLFAVPAKMVAFGQLMPMGCWAFALIAFMQKRDLKFQAVPLALLVSSVYLTAALQKFFHFNLMQERLSVDLAYFSRSSFISLCPNAECSLIEIISFFVVPTELTLGLLFVFPRTRRYGFFMATAFHIFLCSLFNIRVVGGLMLTLEAALAALGVSWALTEILDRKKLLTLFTFSAITGILSYFCFMSELSSIQLIGEFLFTSLLFGPILYFGFLAFASSDQPKYNWDFKVSSANITFAGLLFLHGIFPSWDNYQKFHQWGWSMFSGARWKNKILVVEIVSENVAEYPTYFPVIYYEKVGTETIYAKSFSRDLLTRFVLEIQKFDPSAKINWK